MNFDQLFPWHVLLQATRKLLPGPADPPAAFFLTISFFYTRDVFSVVRDSRMWCPHDIGRDSWVWGEQETLYTVDSPHEVGEEALTERSPLSGEPVPWNGGVMVVESYYFLINNYC